MKAYEMLKRFIRDESGLETVEWAIIAAIIASGAIVAISFIADKVTLRFNTLNEAIK